MNDLMCPQLEVPYSESENRLLTLSAVLSNYDMFSVQVNGAAPFYATSIQHRKDHFLEFRKMFAVPSFTDGKVVACSAQPDGSFSVQTKFSTYIIRPLHSKPEWIRPSYNPTLKGLTDLMKANYFGERLNQYRKEEHDVLLVVDPYLIGELTEGEQYQIQRIINVYLDGKRQSLQIPRTVYYRIPFGCKDNNIFAGIFDLALKTPVNGAEKMIYSNKMSENVEPSEIHNYQGLLYQAAFSAYGKNV